MKLQRSISALIKGDKTGDLLKCKIKSEFTRTVSSYVKMHYRVGYALYIIADKALKKHLQK